jgi:hypothetical protein
MVINYSQELHLKRNYRYCSQITTLPESASIPQVENGQATEYHPAGAHHMNRTVWLAGTIVVLLTAAEWTSATAAVVPDSYEIEVYAGAYKPDPAVLDENVSYGVRIGYNFAEHVSIRGVLSSFDTEGTFTTYHGEFGQVNGTINYRSTILEFPLVIRPHPEKAWLMDLFFGPGFSFVSYDQLASDERFEYESGKLEGSGFTVVAGIGVQREFFGRLFLHLVGQSHWYAAREQDRLDLEATLGLGVMLGR